MVEDARLVRTHRVAGRRILDVPRMTREVDARVGGQQLANVTIAYFTLLCQTKV